MDLLDPVAAPFVAKLTAKTLDLDAVTWLYSFEEYQGQPTTATRVQAAPGRQGSATISPARELNNSEVATGGLVLMWCRGFVDGQLAYEFAATDGTLVDDGITVKGGWTAETFTDIGTIDFDPVYTLVTESPTGEANVFLVEASATDGGVLTAGAQSISGKKTFTDGYGFYGELVLGVQYSMSSGTDGNSGSGLGWTAYADSTPLWQMFLDTTWQIRDSGSPVAVLDDNGLGGFDFLLVGNDSRFCVGGSNGGSITTGGLTFLGGLYISGTATGGGVSDSDYGDITVTASGATWTIDAGVVTFAKMQAISANVLLGNDAAGTTVQEIACTPFARTILDDVDAAAVRTTIGVGAGTGDVVGPASSVASEIVLFDGTTGKLVKRATGTGFVRAASGVYSAAAIALADLPVMTALSVLGNPTSSAVIPADIPASTDHSALIRSGIALGFGKVDPRGRRFSGARVYMAGNYTIAAGAYVSLPFDTAAFNLDGIWNSGVNPTRLTIPTGMAGRWKFTALAGYVNAVPTATAVFFRLFLNGTTEVGFDQDGFTTSAVAIYGKPSHTAQFAAGDYIQLQVFPNVGGTIFGGAPYTWLQAEFLGVD